MPHRIAFSFTKKFFQRLMIYSQSAKVIFILVFGLGTLCTMALLRYANLKHYSEVQNLVEQQAKADRDLILSAITRPISSIERLASRLKVDPNMPKTAVESDSIAFQKYLPSIKALAIYKKNGTSLWFHSSSGFSANVLNEYITEHPEVFQNTRDIDAGERSFFTKLSETQIVSFTPIDPSSSEQKFVTVVIDLAKLLTQQQFGESFYVKVLVDGHSIFSSVDSDVFEDSRWTHSLKFSVSEIPMQIVMQPTDEYVEQVEGGKFGIVTGVGLVISFLLGVFGYMVTTSMQQMTLLENSNLLQRAILKSANYLIIVTDAHGIIQTFNPAAEKMLGYQSFEVVGRKTPEFLHTPEEVKELSEKVSKEMGYTIPPSYECFVVKARTYKKADENEWTYVRKDGTRLPVRLSVTAIWDAFGEIAGYLGIGYDLTDEHEIRNHLVIAKQAALDVAQAKTEFLANMSHEIRTPMNGVIGLTELLLQTPLNEKQRSFATTIRSSGQVLMGIINDILDFSKIEAGKLHIERVEISVRSLIKMQVNFQGVRAKEKGLTIKEDIDPNIPQRLMGDGNRIGQILTNLLSNAIKFSEKGQITVRAVLETNDFDSKKWIRFSIIDSGIGISTEQQAKLFQPFQQADGSTSRRYGGTGLGLSISKKLTALMEGTIGVRSEVGKGSEFWFSIPLTMADNQEEVSSAKEVLVNFPQHTFTKGRVLLVEDNSVNQMVAFSQLETLGYSCTTVANGLQALEVLKIQKFDLILMDCHMPEMDGFEATRRIRKIVGDVSQIPIIALTANAMSEDKEKCIAAGMNEYLTKPIEIEKLSSILQKFILNQEAA